MKQLSLSLVMGGLTSLALIACSAAKPTGAENKAKTSKSSDDDSLASTLPVAGLSELGKVYDLKAEFTGGDIDISWTSLKGADSYTVNWKSEGAEDRGNETTKETEFSIENVVTGIYVISVLPNGEDGTGIANSVQVNVPAPPKVDKPVAPPAPTFTLKSSAFADTKAIPVQYAATQKGGMNQSPPLNWGLVPPGTASFAIQAIDLDTANQPFLHWMISNIPATSTQLPAGIPGGNNLAQPPEALGAVQRLNYRGPNPPALHRYEFTVYAIKQGETLNLGNNAAANKTELEAKSISRTTLIGTFQ